MKRTHYLDITLYRTYAELKTEASRNYLGLIWWVLDPILFMLVFYFVFSYLRARPEEHFVPFLLIGLVFWRWFQKSLLGGSRALISNSGLLQTIYIPKILLPLPNLLSDLFKLMIVVLLLLVFLWLSGMPPSEAYLALPVVFAIQAALILATTLLLAALMPMVPDLRFLVENVIQLMFFVSGVFFSVEMMPPEYHGYFHMNPMANLIEAYRAILMHGRWPDWTHLWWIPVLSLVIFAPAAWLLGKLDRVYPKLVIDK